MSETRQGVASGAGHEATAARLGRERRRVFFIATLLSLVTPALLYLTGSWEVIWYALAATGASYLLRVPVFLLLVHLLLALVLMPISYYGGFVLGHAFGLSRQSRKDWFTDWAKATVLIALFGTLVGGVYLWSVVEFQSGWWVVFAAILSLGTVLLTFATPYLLLPLFFRMRPLADESTVQRVRDLLRRAGTDVREVCSLDVSRRTAEANAAVIGIGRSRRVVLADTLLAAFSPTEVDAVVAHEIGHHRKGHVPQLLAGHVLLIWAGLALAAWLGPLSLPLLSLPYLAYVPGYPMLLSVTQVFILAVLPITNWWSRRLEADADLFALHLTRDPRSFVGAMQRLGQQNLLESRPPRWAEVLLGTHPSLHRRIARAEQWAGS